MESAVRQPAVRSAESSNSDDRSGMRSGALSLLDDRFTLHGPPWGRAPDGTEIRDVSGKLLRAVLLELEDVVFEQTLEEVAERDSAQGAGLLPANDDVYEVGLAFVERLEERMPDARFRLTRERVLNEWNHYSYEFFFVALALAIDMARDERFVDRLGHRTMSAAMLAMIRPFTLDQVVGQYPRLAGRLISRADLRVEELETERAVVTLRSARESETDLTGHHTFTRRCTCALHRTTLRQLPSLLKGLPPMVITEEACQAYGDPVCRWTLEWTRSSRRVGPGTAAGMLTGMAGTWGVLQSPDVNPLLTIPALGFPALLGIAVDQIIAYRQRIAERNAVVREQVAQFEAQYAQLQQQNSELQAYNVQLEDKVRKRTAALERARRELEQKASTDALTGLWNRHYFQQFADRETARAHRYKIPLSAIMIDVDHFKHYNDTNGHQQGDEVLRRVAAILKQSVREVDALARYGGEEFVVILPETGFDGARKTAEKLNRAIAEHDFPYGENQPLGRVTASMGVATLDLSDSDEHVDDVVGRADAALYASKEFGRNRVSPAIRDYTEWLLPRRLAAGDSLMVAGAACPDLKANVRERVLKALRTTLAASVRADDALGVNEDGWWQLVVTLGAPEQADPRLADLKERLRASVDSLGLKQSPKVVVRGCVVTPGSPVADSDHLLATLDRSMRDATREREEAPATAVLEAITE